MKQRLFIGSSFEGLDVAHAVQEVLQHYFYVTPWSQGVFKPSTTALNSLLSILDESDYGIFVFTPDDIATIRDQTKRVVRDNVVFELGLFIGRLGVASSFWLVPSGCDDLHLPSDLLGVQPATYDASHPNIVASVGPACSQIRRAIKADCGRAAKTDSRSSLEEEEDQQSQTDLAIGLSDALGKKTIRLGNEDIPLLGVLMALSDVLNKGFRPGTGEYDYVFCHVWRALSQEANDELVKKLRGLERMTKRYSDHIAEIHEAISEVEQQYEIDTAHLLSPLIASGAVSNVDEGEWGGGVHFRLSDAGNEVLKRLLFASED